MRGNITSLFYSPLPSPLQQERELGAVATHCFYCVDTHAPGGYKTLVNSLMFPRSFDMKTDANYSGQFR